MAGAREQSSWADLGAAWNAAIEFSCAVAVYGVGGYFADKWLGTTPWLFLLGLFLGMALGIYLLMKRAEHMDRVQHDRAVAERAGRASG